jgi:drug/metabolite transporter (DMT)-like permease
MPADLSAPLLGLASAASWGAGDFCGGLAAKRSPLLGVLAVAYAAGVALVAAAALLGGEAAPGGAALGWAVAAGVAGTAGLAALYRGLAVGRMALVAPVSAVLSAALPVAWAALHDGPPPPAKLAGVALALLGIWLVARTGLAALDRQGLVLGAVAGAGFGAFLVLMHVAGAGGGTYWPLAAARGTSLALVLAVALARGGAWTPPAAALPVVLLTGALDAAGNALFVLASQAGPLDTAAVLSSLYPVSTVLLAAALLGERVSRSQGAGIAAVLGAIALISG